MTKNPQNNNASPTDGWSEEEKTAMKERAKEIKAAKNQAEDEQAVFEKISAMPDVDRVMATRLHELIKEKFPNLHPKTWYGMPAYYLDKKVLLFFQSGQRFGTRYCTLGFSDAAKLDDGNFWSTSYALISLEGGVEDRIAALINKAIG